MELIFIFSLPRSGSTLLQRILGASEEVSTATEPWIILPHLYATKMSGTISEYWHYHSNIAIQDFCRELPNGMDDYYIELVKFLKNLYQYKMKENSKYFLDKTPRYSLICEDIIEIMPDAKFIFLWRNPLSIVASIILRWTKNKWRINHYNVDLYKGLENLIDCYGKYKDSVYSIKYEEIVSNPKRTIKNLFEFLNINYDESILKKFYLTPLNGAMGERSGSSIFKNKIGVSSVNNWKKTINSNFRKLWAKKYLAWIGRERLRIIGYDYETLLYDINSIKSDSLLNNFIDIANYYFIGTRNLLSPLYIGKGSIRSFFYS